MGTWNYGPLDGDAKLGWMIDEFSPAALKPIQKASRRRYAPNLDDKNNIRAELRVAAYAYSVLAENGLWSWVNDDALDTGCALIERYTEVLDDKDAFCSWKDPARAEKIFHEELARLTNATELVRDTPGVAARVANSG